MSDGAVEITAMAKLTDGAVVSKCSPTSTAADHSTCLLVDLQPGTLYHVSVKSCTTSNRGTDCQHSSAVEAKTLEPSKQAGGFVDISVHISHTSV